MGMPIHASCIAIDGTGVLLRGPSGSGKSDLALRLIDGGALLVADDQVELEVIGGALFASPPDILAGKIEARGIGILENLPWHRAPVALIVDLVAREDVERLPFERASTINGVELPYVLLAAFEASTPAKIRSLLASLEANRSTLDSISQS
jgi:HPr kinase/phosphorylase